MFCLLFEALPRKEQWDAYLADAKMLRPGPEQAAALVEAVPYRSLTRGGWILSLSGWRDGAAAAGRNARMSDDEARDMGWSDMLADYRLRVGEVVSDTRCPDGRKIAAPGADDAMAGHGTYVTLVDAKQAPEWVRANNPQEAALYLGFDLYSYGDCISWDIFDAVLSPGNIVLLVTWRDAWSAIDHAATQIVPDDARVRVIRVVRDDATAAGGDGRAVHPGAAPREIIGA